MEEETKRSPKNQRKKDNPTTSRNSRNVYSDDGGLTDSRRASPNLQKSKRLHHDYQNFSTDDEKKRRKKKTKITPNVDKNNQVADETNHVTIIKRISRCSSPSSSCILNRKAVASHDEDNETRKKKNTDFKKLAQLRVGRKINIWNEALQIYQSASIVQAPGSQSLHDFHDNEKKTSEFVSKNPSESSNLLLTFSLQDTYYGIRYDNTNEVECIDLSSALYELIPYKTHFEAQDEILKKSFAIDQTFIPPLMKTSKCSTKLSMNPLFNQKNNISTHKRTTSTGFNVSTHDFNIKSCSWTQTSGLNKNENSSNSFSSHITNDINQSGDEKKICSFEDTDENDGIHSRNEMNDDKNATSKVIGVHKNHSDESSDDEIVIVSNLNNSTASNREEPSNTIRKASSSRFSSRPKANLPAMKNVAKIQSMITAIDKTKLPSTPPKTFKNKVSNRRSFPRFYSHQELVKPFVDVILKTSSSQEKIDVTQTDKPKLTQQFLHENNSFDTVVSNFTNIKKREYHKTMVAVRSPDFISCANGKWNDEDQIVCLEKHQLRDGKNFLISNGTSYISDEFICNRSQRKKKKKTVGNEQKKHSQDCTSALGRIDITEDYVVSNDYLSKLHDGCADLMVTKKTTSSPIKRDRKAIRVKSSIDAQKSCRIDSSLSTQTLNSSNSKKSSRKTLIKASKTQCINSDTIIDLGDCHQDDDDNDDEIVFIKTSRQHSGNNDRKGSSYSKNTNDSKKRRSDKSNTDKNNSIITRSRRNAKSSSCDTSKGDRQSINDVHSSRSERNKSIEIFNSDRCIIDRRSFNRNKFVCCDKVNYFDKVSSRFLDLKSDKVSSSDKDLKSDEVMSSDEIIKSENIIKGDEIINSDENLYSHQVINDGEIISEEEVSCNSVDIINCGEIINTEGVTNSEEAIVKDKTIVDNRLINNDAKINNGESIYEDEAITNDGIIIINEAINIDGQSSIIDVYNINKIFQRYDLKVRDSIMNSDSTSNHDSINNRDSISNSDNKSKNDSTSISMSIINNNDNIINSETLNSNIIDCKEISTTNDTSSSNEKCNPDKASNSDVIMTISSIINRDNIISISGKSEGIKKHRSRKSDICSTQPLYTLNQNCHLIRRLGVDEIIVDDINKLMSKSSICSQDKNYTTFDHLLQRQDTIKNNSFHDTRLHVTENRGPEIDGVDFELCSQQRLFRSHPRHVDCSNSLEKTREKEGSDKLDIREKDAVYIEDSSTLRDDSYQSNILKSIVKAGQIECSCFVNVDKWHFVDINDATNFFFNKCDHFRLHMNRTKIPLIDIMMHQSVNGHAIPISGASDSTGNMATMLCDVHLVRAPPQINRDIVKKIEQTNHFTNILEVTQNYIKHKDAYELSSRHVLDHSSQASYYEIKAVKRSIAACYLFFESFQFPILKRFLEDSVVKGWSMSATSNSKSNGIRFNNPTHMFIGKVLMKYIDIPRLYLTCDAYRLTKVHYPTLLRMDRTGISILLNKESIKHDKMLLDDETSTNSWVPWKRIYNQNTFERTYSNVTITFGDFYVSNVVVPSRRTPTFMDFNSGAEEANVDTALYTKEYTAETEPECDSLEIFSNKADKELTLTRANLPTIGKHFIHNEPIAIGSGITVWRPDVGNYCFGHVLNQRSAKENRQTETLVVFEDYFDESGASCFWMFLSQEVYWLEPMHNNMKRAYAEKNTADAVVTIDDTSQLLLLEQQTNVVLSRPSTSPFPKIRDCKKLEAEQLAALIKRTDVLDTKDYKFLLVNLDTDTKREERTNMIVNANADLSLHSTVIDLSTVTHDKNEDNCSMLACNKANNIESDIMEVEVIKERKEGHIPSASSETSSVEFYTSSTNQGDINNNAEVEYITSPLPPPLNELPLSTTSSSNRDNFLVNDTVADLQLGCSSYSMSQLGCSRYSMSIDADLSQASTFIHQQDVIDTDPLNIGCSISVWLTDVGKYCKGTIGSKRYFKKRNETKSRIDFEDYTDCNGNSSVWMFLDQENFILENCSVPHHELHLLDSYKFKSSTSPSVATQGSPTAMNLNISYDDGLLQATNKTISELNEQHRTRQYTDDESKAIDERNILCGISAPTNIEELCKNPPRSLTLNEPKYEGEDGFPSESRIESKILPVNHDDCDAQNFTFDQNEPNCTALPISVQSKHSMGKFSFVVTSNQVSDRTEQSLDQKTNDMQTGSLSITMEDDGFITSDIPIGSCVSVWRTDAGKYCKGYVSNQRYYKRYKQSKYRIDFDDYVDDNGKSSVWIFLAQEKFKVESHPELSNHTMDVKTKHNQKTAEQLKMVDKARNGFGKGNRKSRFNHPASAVIIGSRIEVWRSVLSHPSYCSCTVTATRVIEGDVEHFVEFDDDSSKCWLNLFHETIIHLPPRAFVEITKVIVGSRVEVYWEKDDQFYPGTVTDKGKKSIQVLYDDGESWTENVSNTIIRLWEEHAVIVLSDNNFSDNGQAKRNISRYPKRMTSSQKKLLQGSNMDIEQLSINTPLMEKEVKQTTQYNEGSIISSDSTELLVPKKKQSNLRNEHNVKTACPRLSSSTTLHERFNKVDILSCAHHDDEVDVTDVDQVTRLLSLKRKNILFSANSPFSESLSGFEDVCCPLEVNMKEKPLKKKQRFFHDTTDVCDENSSCSFHSNTAFRSVILDDMDIVGRSNCKLGRRRVIQEDSGDESTSTFEAIRRSDESHHDASNLVSHHSASIKSPKKIESSNESSLRRSLTSDKSQTNSYDARSSDSKIDTSDPTKVCFSVQNLGCNDSELRHDDVQLASAIDLPKTDRKKSLGSDSCDSSSSSVELISDKPSESSKISCIDNNQTKARALIHERDAGVSSDYQDASSSEGIIVMDRDLECGHTTEIPSVCLDTSTEVHVHDHSPQPHTRTNNLCSFLEEANPSKESDTKQRSRVHNPCPTIFDFLRKDYILDSGETSSNHSEATSNSPALTRINHEATILIDTTERVKYGQTIKSDGTTTVFESANTCITRVLTSENENDLSEAERRMICYFSSPTLSIFQSNDTDNSHIESYTIQEADNKVKNDDHLIRDFHSTSLSLLDKTAQQNDEVPAVSTSEDQPCDRTSLSLLNETVQQNNSSFNELPSVSTYEGQPYNVEDRRREQCAICEQREMKNPRSTQCFHLFCEDCIRSKYALNKSCPICHESLGDKLILQSYENNPSTFHAIEMLDMSFWTIRAVFPSASSASRALKGAPSSRSILGCCRSRKLSKREFSGYFWQFANSKDLVVYPNFIYQIELDTGIPIAVFPSTRQATQRTGVSSEEIQRVLNRVGSPNGGGFFWRYMYDTHGPWKMVLPKNKYEIEQICLQTGSILRTFDSFLTAKKAFGIEDGRIREACIGARDDALGYFWRMKGSDNLPSSLKLSSKKVLIRKFQKGAYFREFPNSKSASTITGVDTDVIIHLCKTESFAYGYQWSFMVNGYSIREDNYVGKLLIIEKHVGGLWLEGKITYSDNSAGIHTIVFEDGSSRRVRLEESNFLWKVNQEGTNRIRTVSIRE